MFVLDLTPITFHIDGFYTISYEEPPLSFYFEF